MHVRYALCTTLLNLALTVYSTFIAEISKVGSVYRVLLASIIRHKHEELLLHTYQAQEFVMKNGSATNCLVLVFRYTEVSWRGCK